MEERGLEQVATLSLDLAIEPGLSSAHKKMTQKDPRQRVVMEGFDWALMSGLRNDPVTAGDDDKSDQSHEETDRGDSDGRDQGEDEDRHLDEFLSAKRKHAGRRGSPDSPSTNNGRGHTRQSSYASWRSGKSKNASDIGSGDVDAEKGWQDRYHDWRTRQVSHESGFLCCQFTQWFFVSSTIFIFAIAGSCRQSQRARQPG
jgi:hypothetical protein